MYNRYVRDQQGTFTRVSEDIPDHTSAPCGPPPQNFNTNPSPQEPFSSIQNIFGKLGLDGIDTGDLLLLLIIFLLFTDGNGQDEELLIALGLLLIL